MNIEEKHYNADEIQRRYMALRASFHTYIDGVIKPIEQHFQERGQSETAFVDFYLDKDFKDILINDEAEEKIQLAKGVIEQLKSLIHQGASFGKALDSANSLEEECKRASLMRVMAWSLKPPEIRDATDQAQEIIASSKEVGLFQTLYTQAEKRRAKLADEQNLIAASGKLQLEQTDKLIARISDLDEAPIDAIQSFQALLTQILNLTSSFTRFGVTEVMDFRAAGGESYTKMLTLAEQEKGIRSTSRSVIEASIEKATRFAKTQPQIAADWFMPVIILKDFLNKEEDASLINSIDKFDKEIKDKCARWNKADNDLKDADQKLSGGLSRETFWAAFANVLEAENDYSDHQDIDKMAEACIEKIGQSIALEMAQQRQLAEPRWPELEKELINSQDWQMSWLKAKDLPKWLLETEQHLLAWEAEIQDFSTRLMDKLGKFDSDRRKKANQQVDGWKSQLDQDYRSYYAAWNGYAEKRKVIRAFILEIQDLIKQGQQKGNKSPYQDADNRFDAFIKSHGTWAEDKEVKRARDLLSQYLGASDNLKQACASYTAKQWDNCISALAHVGEAGNIIFLGGAIDQVYLDSHLAKGLERTLPAEGIVPFATVLRQLAYVNQAVGRIKNHFENELYDELRSDFDQFDKYGHGDSPVLKDIKESISYEEKVKEYNRRENFGASNYIHKQTINLFAVDAKAKYNQISPVASGNVDWLKAADDLLHRLTDLAPYNPQTLWTGRVTQMQKELRGSFAKHLDERLASLYQSPSGVSKADVQQAFNFAQTARQNEMFSNLNQVTRRWVIYQYYSNQEGPDTPTEQIVKNWREAVRDFPSDSDIIRKFRDRSWEWWLKAIDEGLSQAARGEDVQERLEQLFTLDEAAFSGLFTPVITGSGEKIKPALDPLHPEIKERKASWKAMQQADQDLRNNPQNLSLILKSLREFQKEKGRRSPRPEIDAKIAAISSEFVETECKKGSRAEIEGDRMESVEHYLRALSMHSWDEAQDWVTNHKQDIIGYWLILNDEINQLNETTGDIYLRSAEARKLSARLDELRSCNLSFAREFRDFELRTTDLSRKIQTLEFGLDLLRRLNPCTEKWKNATCPNQEETQISDAQEQLFKYLHSLSARFAKNNVQVVGLTETCEPIFEYLNALKLAIKTLRENLNQGEAYGICLEDCGKIMECISHLNQLEAKCFENWEKWIGKEKIANASRCYEDQDSVYRDWKFTHQGREYPFYAPSNMDGAGSTIVQPFTTWAEGQKKYIINFNLEQVDDGEVEFHAEFAEKEFRSTLSTDMLTGFRDEYSNKTLLLGNFLILAFIEKTIWEDIKNGFQTKDALASTLDSWFVNQSDIKITELRLSSYRNYLQKWVSEVQDQIHNEPRPVVKSCQQIREAIQRAIQENNPPLQAEGPLCQRITNVGQRIVNIQAREDGLLKEYQQHITRINQITALKVPKKSAKAWKTAEENPMTTSSEQEDDVVLNNITELRLFYQYPQANPPMTAEQENIFDLLKIPVNEDVDLVYFRDYRPRHQFFKYVEDCIKSQVAGVQTVGR